MTDYILALDQGTTGSTAALIDAKTFSFIDKVNQEFPQIYPQPGWVEHNLEDIFQSIQSVVKKLLEKNSISPNQILSIGITNQRETTCAFDKEGIPLANAIVWQDRRTASFCESINEHAQMVKEKTGLPIDPYFSATKMKWLLENNPKVKSSNDVHFGTIDTFLLYRLTGGESFATEASNASRTLLMNLKTCDWDNDLLDLFQINKKSLPKILDSFSHFGKTKGLDFLPDGIHICGILGDQQSALFGQAGFKKGQMKCTYGTGAFALLNIGDKISYSDFGLLTTVAYTQNSQACYALEGSCYIAGACIQWLRDNLKIIHTSPEVEKLAQEVKDLSQMEHLLFFPFFTGIASPYWNPHAKAALLGMSRDTNNSHIARAAMEGVCLSINDLKNSLAKDVDFPIEQWRVDGGACANSLFMQMQADISEIELIRPQVIETTAYGAALTAAIGSGNLSFDKLETFWKMERVFTPSQEHQDYYNKKKNLWDETLKRLWIN